MEECTYMQRFVCKRFQLSRDAEMAQMRKQKQRLISENFRLRNKLTKVEQQLNLERMLAMRLHSMLQRASMRLSAITELLSDLFK